MILFLSVYLRFPLCSLDFFFPLTMASTVPHPYRPYIAYIYINVPAHVVIHRIMSFWNLVFLGVFEFKPIIIWARGARLRNIAEKAHTAAAAT